MILFTWKCKGWRRYKGVRKPSCCLHCWLRFKFHRKHAAHYGKPAVLRMKVNEIGVAPEE